MQELIKCMPNWYGSDNWELEVFGAPAVSVKSWFITNFNDAFAGRLAIVPSDSRILQNIYSVESLLVDLSDVYELLADEFSKATLVKLLTYRIMGHRKVKLPVNTPLYWSQRRLAKSLVSSREAIPVEFDAPWLAKTLSFDLKHFALNEVGYPIQLYSTSSGIQTLFLLRQYEYGKRTPPIQAQAGDIVIDAGGCWGDTALYFAHAVGPQGRVYTFEFAPNNLEVLRRNLALNSNLAERVEIVQEALWDCCGEQIEYTPRGPATSLSLGSGSLRARTTTIDELVKCQCLSSVDLIKMDIEGAELKALKGAEQTIRRFRPKLAISAYHKHEDMVVIPNYLTSLDIGYDFYLDHFTIYEGETVLFALPKPK
jgi:FkbM family methyltransferase